MEEFSRRNIKAQNQIILPVYYKNKNVGNYIADIIVENTILLELRFY